jgi:hypothetical protein
VRLRADCPRARGGTTFGPFSGVAGDATQDDITGSLFDPNLPGLDGQITVNWVDADSVDVFFYIGGLGRDLSDASFAMRRRKAV